MRIFARMSCKQVKRVNLIRNTQKRRNSHFSSFQLYNGFCFFFKSFNRSDTISCSKYYENTNRNKKITVYSVLFEVKLRYILSFNKIAFEIIYLREIGVLLTCQEWYEVKKANIKLCKVYRQFWNQCLLRVYVHLCFGTFAPILIAKNELDKLKKRSFVIKLTIKTIGFAYFWDFTLLSQYCYIV